MSLQNTPSTLLNTLQQLLKTSTMKQLTVWAKQIVDEGVDVKELSDVFLYGDRTTALRFSWMLSDIGLYNKAALHNILPYLFEKREQTSINDFKYQFVKYWTIAGIPKQNTAEAINLMFSWLNDSNTNVTTKTHAMCNLFILTKDYPDLKNELIISIEEQFDKTSVSFRIRATKILRELKQ
jgi:hypothetical protein